VLDAVDKTIIVWKNVSVAVVVVVPVCRLATPAAYPTPRPATNKPTKVSMRNPCLMAQGIASGCIVLVMRTQSVVLLKDGIYA